MIKKVAVIVLVIVASLLVAGCTSSTNSNQAASSASQSAASVATKTANTTTKASASVKPSASASVISPTPKPSSSPAPTPTPTPVPAKPVLVWDMIGTTICSDRGSEVVRCHVQAPYKGSDLPFSWSVNGLSYNEVAHVYKPDGQGGYVLSSMTRVYGGNFPLGQNIIITVTAPGMALESTVLVVRCET